MSVHTGAKIPTAGLALHLDSANARSYPSSGTTWFDLSGNGRHYTMYGSVPRSASEGGSWDFTSVGTGTSATRSLGFTPTGTTPLTALGSFTVTAAVKQTQEDTWQTGLFSNAGGADGFRFGPASSGIYYLVGPSYKENVLGSGSISLNRWAVITVVYDRQSQLTATPTVYAYVNGVLVGSEQQNAQTAMLTTAPGIVRSACCRAFIGYLAMVQIHSRALSSWEIQENFNAVRGRYSI